VTHKTHPHIYTCIHIKHIYVHTFKHADTTHTHTQGREGEQVLTDSPAVFASVLSELNFLFRSDLVDREDERRGGGGGGEKNNKKKKKKQKKKKKKKK
jgi:hypothetical protein